MPSFLKKDIMNQFRLVLRCLIVMGIILSLLCYTIIGRLMTKKLLRLRTEYRTAI